MSCCHFLYREDGGETIENILHQAVTVIRTVNMGKTTYQGVILGTTMGIIVATLFILLVGFLYFYRIQQQRKQLILHPLPEAVESPSTSSRNADSCSGASDNAQVST